MSGQLEIGHQPTAWALCINDAESRMVVSIKRDGSVEYGPGYTTDQAAARLFWEAMGDGLRKFLAATEPSPKDVIP